MKNPKIGKIVRGLSTLKEVKDNPINFVIDLILSAIISALIPIPFIGAVLTRYKTQILWGIGSIFLLGAFCLSFVFALLFSSFSLPNGNTGLPAGLQGGALFDALVGYREAGFVDTATPSRNPLGGDGFTNSITTMDYHDPSYAFFDGIHTGMDFVPSGVYYQTNQAYIKTNAIIVFATMNGQATYAVDQYGAQYVDVINSDSTLLTRYVHLATSFVSTGQQISAGQPIGVMGSTGESTGTHLHYEVRVQQGGKFVTVDPKRYIQ